MNCLLEEVLKMNTSWRLSNLNIANFYEKVKVIGVMDVNVHTRELLLYPILRTGKDFLLFVQGPILGVVCPES